MIAKNINVNTKERGEFFWFKKMNVNIFCIAWNAEKRGGVS